MAVSRSEFGRRTEDTDVELLNYRTNSRTNCYLSTKSDVPSQGFGRAEHHAAGSLYPRPH